jgi:hypothetical protein
MSIHPYEYTYVHPTPMCTFKRLSRLILRFTKPVTKSISLSTETLPPTEKIISRKYNIHIKSRI